MTNERFKEDAEQAKKISNVTERAKRTAENLRDVGASATADWFEELAIEGKSDRHWTCKNCFGNNGDEDIDDFGICKGCRDKEVDK